MGTTRTYPGQAAPGLLASVYLTASPGGTNMAGAEVTPTNYSAQELANAVRDGNKDTALRLLESAGGACQTRELAQAAKLAAANDRKVGYVDFDLSVNEVLGTETLAMFRSSTNNPPRIGITQKKCER